MRRLGVALAAGALVLSLAGIAQAGTLSRVDATTLRYDADPGETNRIFVSTDSEGVRVIDTSATVTAGAGCTLLPATGASCRQQIAHCTGRAAHHPVELVRAAV